MYSISNLGLNMPGQQKPQGYFTSVGASFGFGDRPDPIAGEHLSFPGTGQYDLRHSADTNSEPKWK
jgi:hypothetical protein